MGGNLFRDGCDLQPTPTMNAIRLQYWNQTVVRHKPRGRPVNQDLPNERLQWDWTIKDADLARQHGLTRERIRQIRWKLGVGPAKYKHLHYIHAEVDAERMFRDGIVMDAYEFAAKHKILVGRARIIMRRRNCIVRPKTRVHPWHLFNLDLPSKVLAEIWGGAICDCDTEMACEIRTPAIPLRWAQAVNS